MTDWTSGYVADIGYTFGYYTELNPLRIKLAFLNARLVPPDSGTACELGFGQGMSANIHAAATVTHWHGSDFNPVQAGFAKEMAAVSGASVHLHDDAFADFTNRADLPDFDFIGLHGIWSWINDENRAVIVEFIRRKLKVGGVVYVSYNTLPGWATFAPMRHLLTEHAARLGSEGTGIANRIGGALDFADKLLATNPAYAIANPQVVARTNKLRGKSRNYLAHEYFNRDWEPMHFATMAQWLEPAKLSYACSANYLDYVEAINLSPEQQAFLKDIPDAMFRETIRDFMVNQQFRKDYWVKGARRINTLEQLERLRQQKVVLVSARDDISLKVTGAQGVATMSESVYKPVLDFLADCKPKTIGQIELALKDSGVNFAKLLQAVLILTGAGHLAAVQVEDVIAQSKKRCDKLNLHLITMARGSNDGRYLASPVTGGGVPVGRFQQLFLLALTQGKKQPAEWAEFVWQIVSAQGQKILKEGKALESTDESLAELTEQANVFASRQLPILRALKIA
jgi:SAM-dependent methyltransferase